MAVMSNEKVYVAVGDDYEEGATALDWTFEKWSSFPITVVILYVNQSSDFVNTPFGKLPVSSVNEERLKVLRELQEERTDILLSDYTAQCKKVKAEIHKVGNFDRPVQDVILDLITQLHITRLVMGITFMMRPSAGSSGSAINGSFFVHQNKPDFCKVYILSGGKLVFLKEEAEDAQVEDGGGHSGVSKPRHKQTSRVWPGKVGSSIDERLAAPPSSLALPSPSTLEVQKSFEIADDDMRWRLIVQEIRDHCNRILEENGHPGGDNIDPTEAKVALEISLPEMNISDSDKITEEEMKALRLRLKETQRMIHLKTDEARAEVDRQAKAKWAIQLTNHRAEELKALTKEETTTRIHLNKMIEETQEQAYEVMEDIKESRNRLTSLQEIQSELSYKLRVSSFAKSQAESQLQVAATARGKLVREIEELRKKRGILQRRIEFCKEKDAIRIARIGSAPTVDTTSTFREFTPEDISLATGGFSVGRRLKSGGEWTNVYKGKIHHTQVVVKIIDSEILSSTEAFSDKVNFLLSVRHPQVVSLIGFCTHLNCLVFEYMQNGCIRDILFSRRKSKMLQWHQRASIASDICSLLNFLHLAEPNPIVHGSLNPSSILLDQHLVAKINPFQLRPCSRIDSNVHTDINAFGVLLLQLLCGRNWGRVDQEVLMAEHQSIFSALDQNAGEWPLDLVIDIVRIAVKCLSVDSDNNFWLIMSSVIKELNQIKRKIDDYLPIQYSVECKESEEGLCLEVGKTEDVPSIFICRLFKEMMKNPHIAADGYTYELEAIEEWIELGNETSPVTNERLEHKHLIPNLTLRALIEDRQSPRSTNLYT